MRQKATIILQGDDVIRLRRMLAPLGLSTSSALVMIVALMQNMDEADAFARAGLPPSLPWDVEACIQTSVTLPESTRESLKLFAKALGRSQRRLTRDILFHYIPVIDSLLRTAALPVRAAA